MKASAYAVSAWVIVFASPSGDAPKFTDEYELAPMVSAIEMLVLTLIAGCMKRFPPGGKTSSAILV